jgi:hypothetical protein
MVAIVEGSTPEVRQRHRVGTLRPKYLALSLDRNRKPSLNGSKHCFANPSCRTTEHMRPRDPANKQIIEDRTFDPYYMRYHPPQDRTVMRLIK